MHQRTRPATTRLSRRAPHGLVAGLLASVLLPACAAAARGPFPAESPRRAVGVVGRTCDYVSTLDQLPALRDLTRVGTVGNLALWGRGQSSADTLLASVRYDGDGRLAWVRAIRSGVSEERTYELERLLLASLSVQGARDWGMRLRFVGGELDEVLPSVRCEPEWRGQVLDVPLSLGGQRERAEARQARGRPFTLRVALDEEGRVRGVRLEQGTGSRALDQYLLDWARASRFEPKLHDGFGVPSEYVLRSHFRNR